MKISPCVVGIFLSVLCGAVMPATTQEKNMQSLETLAEGSNKFAIALYQALSKNSNGNLIVCPISLQLVLALSYVGARGQTAKEIEQALGLPGNRDDILNGHKLLIEELRNPVLKLANKIFVEKTFGMKQEFQNAATNYFLSSAESLNFLGDPESSRGIINKWVEDNTNQKIKNLLAEGTVDALTRLVLVNAVHFKAKWLHTFDSEDTEEEPFYVTPTETVKVQMMHIKKKFGYKYHPELQAKILEMPYEGNEFRMIIILPDAKDGLASVEAKLPSLNLASEFANLEPSTVNVALPRFKMEETMDLENILIELGMPSLFAGANFSGISDEPLAVSKAIQKAFIEVNEEGTEAAASTDMGEARSLHLNEKYFAMDHPFIFFIHNPKTKVFSFIGSLKKPKTPS